MIISKTPYRISFFGGGTDYPVWFREHGGAVLSTTIDKYCYITCRYLPPFFEHKYRIVYSKIESTVNIEDIQHVSVKECLKFLNFKCGIEIHHDGDLPARTGIGSSSSFTVGLLHSLYALQGKMINKMDLAKNAIYIEQELNKENVGSQDQAAAAFGGLNKTTFLRNGDIQVEPLTISREKINNFQNHFLLFFTGLSRTASEIAKHQIENTKQKTSELKAMLQMVDESIKILNTNKLDFSEFGKLLDETWRIKKSLSHKVSTSEIDEIYEIGKRNGAVGGKLIGAGGGGFLLFFVKPEHQQKVRDSFRNLLEVPFKFEDMGSQIIFYQPNGYGS